MAAPKTSNPPDRIYLQVGDLDSDCDFSELHEVTWCADAQFVTDIEYRLVRRQRAVRRQQSFGKSVKSETND